MQSELENSHQLVRAYPNYPRVYIRRGMEYFKLAKIQEAIEDFDRAENLDPSITPYLWQRGLAYYYVNRFADGAKQFEIDLKVNSNDVEETVWRYLCLARLKGVSEAQNCLLEVKYDRRLVMRSVYKFYAGQCTEDAVLMAGKKQGTSGIFYSYLYLGLYYEVAGDEERARAYIVKAVDDYKINDFMWNVAWVHRTLRDWN
ncbi:tetratricopeptide repeat protein [Oscillatoria salina]|uniref:tetratricopeptide repeat protein n=1 Tax=Oscillatoria salina TaxID=331517 RepID=UPI001CCE77D9|nr:tetratricopeptide repeat protein [Oscillatoria salina]MBZ8180882.1 tetratricopeptide repeat protein [Oscillatoria salina IIICB1]